MSVKTCGNCPHVRLNKTRLMTIAYCGKTEELHQRGMETGL